MRDGDIIVALEGEPVAGVDDLHRLLTDVRVGVSCSLSVLRYTEKLELRVVPEEARQRACRTSALSLLPPSRL